MSDRIQQFDFSIDLLKATLWQYNDAENLQAIIQQEQNWYNTSYAEFWDDWYNDVFNLETANEFGCSVWAIILGVPLSLIFSATDNLNNFGFEQYHKSFNNGNFTNSSGSASTLTLEQKRIVLRLRYYQLVSRGAVPEINSMLKNIFGNLGSAYALDGLNMTMTYVFKFAVPYGLRQIFDYFDLLPRPSGVKINILYEPESSFGFGEFRVNFNNGNFGE